MPRLLLPAVIVVANLAGIGQAQEPFVRPYFSEGDQDSVIPVAMTLTCDNDEGCCSYGSDCSEQCSPLFPECGDLWSRSRLTDGFAGLQPALAEQGIIYDAQLTQFYQGVANGGGEQQFEYGGKLDQFVIFQGEKIGLWKGFEAILHAETRFGEDVIAAAAQLAPVNANMLYPSSSSETTITGLQVLQALNEDWAISFGRINTFDLLQTLYPQTGRGVDGFMNASTFLPMTLGVTVPLVFNGAGVLKMRDKKIEGGLLVLDPQNIPTVSGLDDLFSNGATVLGLWRVFTEFGGKPGSHMLAGSWSSGQFTSLDGHNWVITPGGGISPGQQTGSWSIQYVLEQQLWVDTCNKHRNIGLLSEWGYADADTNPYEWVCNVSLQANGLINGRQADSMGVAWFYSDLSHDLEDLVSPLVDLQNVTGFEVYYNAEVTPWFHLTADLQLVEPADRNSSDTALVLGLRGKISL